ncbi:ERF family protein [Catellatospora sp. NPDC049609]|uniref:ERF family protein n=1 Tax=Catellatospora sp. NPDC049609 TaxID=3155505 RepID=UPI003415485E
MTTTTEGPPVREAILDVMIRVGAVGKGDYNQGQKFNFRGIDAVLNAVAPALRAARVIVRPEYEPATVHYLESGGGKRQVHALVHARFEFIGPAGDSHMVQVNGEAMDTGDKAVSKASSVAFRTALIQALALPTDEPDPDSQVYDIGAAPAEDSPSSLRARIASVVQAKGWTLEDAASDFTARMKADIRDADADTLRAYLDKIGGEGK